MNFERLMRVSLAASIAIMPACQKARPPMNDSESLAAQRLSGSWDMRFELVRSPLIALDVARAPHEVRGKLDLLVNSSLGGSYPLVGIPTNYGTYDLDATGFGFDPRIEGRPPTAVAGPASADSIAIILSPEREAGRMILIGHIRGDSIIGTWHVTFTRSSGYGHFVLTRPGL